MKNKCIFVLTMLALVLVLQACMTAQATATSGKTYPPTSPRAVALFIDEEPERSFFEVGRINLYAGMADRIKVYERLKQEAASLGGQGVTNIEASGNNVRATVIRFE